MSDVRILIADDHEIVRRGVCALIASHRGWQVCGEAVDGREAVEKTRQLAPDIVILDIHMPGLNGLEAARQILRHKPAQKILVFTIADADALVQELLRAGVKGYVLKSDAAGDLTAAIEALQQNRTFFNSRIEQMILDGFLRADRGHGASHPGDASPLTAREREVLQLLAEGKTTKEAAVTLNLSLKTAETHRARLMRKLDLHNASELVLYAVRNNIVHAPTPIALRMPLATAAGD